MSTVKYLKYVCINKLVDFNEEVEMLNNNRTQFNGKINPLS